VTKNEMGGSHYNLIHGIEGGTPPQVDRELAPRIFRKLHEAIQRGLVRSCHDLSEGGLAVTVAEMAFAGGVGADITALRQGAAREADEILLFSESASRFVVEVMQDKASALQDCLGDEVPLAQIGQTCKEPRLRIAGANSEWILWAQLADLKEVWQKPLRW